MSTRRKLAATVLAIGVTAGAVGAVTLAAFFSQATNPGSSFAAGTVQIADNDAGGAMLSLSSAVPGNSSTGCIKVDYTGSLDSTVRLYASVSGTLAPYLDLVVTRGTIASPTFPSCTGFSADATDYIGSGAGVIYSGTLSSYPTTYGTGIVDASSGSQETWTTSEAHVYRFQITLQSNAAAQGLSSTATFTWEAQNL